MFGKLRVNLAAVFVCLAFIAYPGPAQARATYATEFDAALTVTSTTESESFDGWGELSGRTQRKESYSTDLIVSVYRNKLDRYIEDPFKALKNIDYRTTSMFEIASGSNSLEDSAGKSSRFPVKVNISSRMWERSIEGKDKGLVLTYVYDGQGTLDKTGVGMHISPIPPGSGKGPVVSLVSGYRLVVSAGNIQSFTDPSAPRAKARYYDQYLKKWIDDPQKYGIAPSSHWVLSNTHLYPEIGEDATVKLAEFPDPWELQKFLTDPKGSATFTVKASYYVDNSSEKSTTDISVTLTLTPRPQKLEAVIYAPSGYEEWLPKGGRDEKSAGNGVVITTRLQVEDDPFDFPMEKVQFRYELVDTSKERGVCLNSPGLDLAAAMSGSLDEPEYDLKISAKNNPHLEVSEDGQTATTKEQAINPQFPSISSVRVDCFDWGAHAKLKVTAVLEDGTEIPAHVDGKPDKTEFAIPIDDNDNYVADAWEKQMKVFGRNLPAAWDESPQPKGQRANGDGISLYEKYRGLYCSKLDAGGGGGAGAGSVTHERLDPNYKYLFVCDENGILSAIAHDPIPEAAARSFEILSGLRIRLVSGSYWTGPGSIGDARRIVNFNQGDDTNAIEQTALHVTVTDDYNLVPPGWLEFWESSRGEPLIVGVFDTWQYSSGYAFPDIGGGKIGSPRYTYQINISLGLLDYNLKRSAAAHVRRQDWACEEDDTIERNFQEWMDEHPHTYDDFHPEPGQSTELLDAYEARREQQKREHEALEERIKQAVEDYIDAHPDEWQRRRAIQIAYVLAHELGHGVGMSHHADDSGDPMCIITVFQCDYNTDPYDVLDARQLDKIPNKICPSCMKQIVVSDGKQ